MHYRIIKPDVILSSMMQDREMAKQFIAMYLTQSKPDFERLTDSISVGDHQEIQRLAHHIKPTMLYIGADTLQRKFQELEDLARHSSPQTEMAEKLDHIKADFDQMLHELTLFMEEISQ